MVNILPLYSSSSGNVFYIEANKTNILIDAGVTYKAINDGLKQKGKSIEDISAIIITHEHIDHIKALPLFCRKHENVPIYACGKTADYIKEMLDERNIASNVRKVFYGQPFKIKDIDILPFETSHDALMPCGYKIKADSKTITYATDLGYVSNEVYDNLLESDYTIIESNYDNALLEFGKYPYNIKRRIKGTTGHLSNDDCASTICKLAKSGNTNFILAHMSENNNTLDIVKNTLESTLLTNGIDPLSLNISYATKSLCNEEFYL